MRTCACEIRRACEAIGGSSFRLRYTPAPMETLSLILAPVNLWGSMQITTERARTLVAQQRQVNEEIMKCDKIEISQITTDNYCICFQTMDHEIRSLEEDGRE
eukprot:197943_1